MIDRIPGPQFNKAIAHPRSAFSHPNAVVHAHGLSTQEKLTLLNRWKKDATELGRPGDEGMTDGEAAVLREIDEAIAALQD